MRSKPRKGSRVLGLALFLVFFLATLLPKTHAQSQLDLLLKTGVEIDTNPARLTDQGSSTDVAQRLFASFDYATLDSDNLLRLDVRLGGKVFADRSEEDAVMTLASAAYEYRGFGELRLLASMSVQDRSERGHVRDYARFSPSFGTRLQLDPVWVSIIAQPEVFLFKPDSDLNNVAIGGAASIGWDPSELWSLSASYSMNRRSYSQETLNISEESIALGDDLRVDWNHTAGLSLAYSGTVFVRVGAYAQRNESNSDGKQFWRYVARVGATAELPGALFLDLHGSLQRTVFDQIGFVDPTFTIDDENRNTVEVTLSRDLLDWMRIEARYSVFLQEFGGDETSYERHLGYLGLTFQVGD
ncbi:MAG: hypothetical protein KC561_00590 [Myxococcales bacterium]|nr:hypothetical protein [Myxococcales bacterium]